MLVMQAPAAFRHLNHRRRSGASKGSVKSSFWHTRVRSEATAQRHTDDRPDRTKGAMAGREAARQICEAVVGVGVAVWLGVAWPGATGYCVPFGSTNMTKAIEMENDCRPGFFCNIGSCDEQTDVCKGDGFECQPPCIPEH